MGFTKASKPGSAVPVTPSKAALEAAAKRLKVWEEEDLSLIQTGAASSANAPEVSLARPVLASVLNSPGRKSTTATSSKSFSTPIRSNNPRAFKSPLLSNSSGGRSFIRRLGQLASHLPNTLQETRLWDLGTPALIHFHPHPLLLMISPLLHCSPPKPR